nr:ABC transporter substrate-binding protein [Heyndrickxia oleronia]
MKKYHLFHWLTAIMLIIFLAGCQSNQSSNEPKKEDTPEQVKVYTVKDDTGKEVSFKKAPETVISLQPSNTEILFAIGAGDKVIGATEYDNYPEQASKIERVSDSVTINTEKIIALKPDIVIAYTIGDENALKPIEDAGIPVFVIQSASSFEDVYGDIQQISEVMGVKEKGEELITNIRTHINDIENKLKNIEKPKRVYFEISPSPDIYSTGKNTFQQEILQTAGVENIFGNQEGWIKVSEETVIKLNPEIIATTVDYIEGPVAEIKARKGWETIEAIKKDRVYQLDSDIMSRPGPRIAEAVELVAKMAYQEYFK